MAYVHRTIEENIIKTGKSFPCLVVYGPRQVGKSTTAEMLYGDSFRKVTLDNINDRALANQNPRAFLETYGWPLIIDEIQKAPGLLDEIKQKIDEQRLIWLKTGTERQLMYILTGSNQFELQQGISDSLAGRCGIINMASFSQAEKYNSAGTLFDPDIELLLKHERETPVKYRTRAEIFSDIFQGGMPDVVTGVSQRDVYYRSYVNTYIEKDVRKLITADNEMLFRNFLSIVALRTSQELHYEIIANNVGIDTRTCKRWISILETSGIICLMQPYMANISNRIIKAPKLYFMDSGLCAYLCRWPSAELLEQCAMNGAFFETYAVSELIKNLYAHNIDPKDVLYYYRDVDQKEIDLLFIKENSIYPIEIKTGSSPKNPTRNFSVLQKYHMPVKPGLILDTCDKIRPVNELAYTYPVYLLGM
ncbi:MAG: ATP-binding protein [Flexilinea sp.]|nr:ATP-binding protein [Flexilinea sp.]